MKAFLTIAMVMFIGMSFGQKTTKVMVATIQTSAECGSCKTRIENKLNYTSGIKFAELNLEDKKVTVKYNSTKIKLEEIKKIISETGYDADEVKAVPEAVEKLPACCKPGGMEKMKNKK